MTWTWCCKTTGFVIVVAAAGVDGVDVAIVKLPMTAVTLLIWGGDNDDDDDDGCEPFGLDEH